MKGVEHDKPFLMRMPLADFVRCSALAERSGRSLAAWVREAMMEKAKRENGERGAVVGDGNRSRTALTPGRQVRVSGAGLGRLDGVSSAEFAEERERLRMLAVKEGRCTADVAHGSRCKLCGRVHTS